MVLFGQILLESHLITKEDLEMALEEQKESERLLGEILRERGLLTSGQVWRTWLMQLSKRYNCLYEVDAPSEVRRLAFGDLAEHYLAVPIALEEETIILIKGFSDLPIIDDLRVLYGAERITVVTINGRLSGAVRRQYPSVTQATCSRCGDVIASPQARLTVDESGGASFLCEHCWVKLSHISGVFDGNEQAEEPHDAPAAPGGAESEESSS